MSEAGKGVTREDVIKLRDLLERDALVRGDIPLSSGIQSSYYFDAKRVTLEPEGERLLGNILEAIIRGYGAEAVGGLMIGATPIADAISMPRFIVRDDRKGHGTGERIAAAQSIRGANSDLRRGLRVAIVDDVVTTGRSIQKAIEAVKANGCEVAVVVALIERPEGETERELGSKYNYIPLFASDEKGKLSLTAQAEELTKSLVV